MPANRGYVAPEIVYYNNAVSPERLLLIEILKSAVRDIIHGELENRRSAEYHYRRNALYWINSNDEKGTHHFTFVEICDELRLEANEVRRNIFAAIESGRAQGLFDKRAPATYRLHKMERRRVEQDHKEHKPLSDLSEFDSSATSARETRHQLAFEANRVFVEKNR